MRWRIGLGIVLSGGVLFLLIRHLDLTQLLTALRAVDYRYLLPLALIIAVGEGWSVLKWQQILSPMKQISFKRLYTASMVGHLAHVLAHLLPFLRVSLLLRSYVVSKKEGLPISTLLATIVVDRLIDGLTFLGILAFVLVWLNLPPHIARVEGLLRGGGVVMLGFYLGLIVLLVGLRFRPEKAQALLTFLLTPLPDWIRVRLLALSTTFMAGITLPRSGVRWVIIIGAAIFQKLFAASHLYIIGLASGVSLSPLTYLFLMIFLGSLMVIAGSLGIMGSFEAGAVLALGWYGVSAETALSMALVIRIVGMGTIVILGLLSFWMEGLIWTEVRGEMAKRLSRELAG